MEYIMGVLISKLTSYLGQKEHKLVLVGLDNAGKASILNQLLMCGAVHTSSTIGSNVEEVIYKNLHFIMWDLGGEEALRSAWSSTTYYTNTEFVILVIDSTDQERLSITKDELYRILNHEKLSRAALLVYANKQDVEGAITPSEISYRLNLTSIENHKWKIQGCCALTGEGLYKGLEWIANRAAKLVPKNFNDDPILRKDSDSDSNVDSDSDSNVDSDSDSESY